MCTRCILTGPVLGNAQHGINKCVKLALSHEQAKAYKHNPVNKYIGTSVFLLYISLAQQMSLCIALLHMTQDTLNQDTGAGYDRSTVSLLDEDGGLKDLVDELNVNYVLFREFYRL